MAFIWIALQGLKRELKDPVGMVMTLAVPMVLIVAIGMVAGSTPFGAAPEQGFDALSYIAPGMALFFMMLSVRQAARNAADDADRGVRDRLRRAPVSAAAVLAGGTASHVVLLFLQLVVLVGVSTALYGLRWGPAGTVLLVCVGLALAGSGWVALLVSAGRTPGRINALGMALTLVFGIVSRSFAAVIPTTPWMDGLARVTPNYWGLHAFASLALGGGASSVTPDLLWLGLMCAATWAAAILIGRPAHGGRR